MQFLAAVIADPGPALAAALAFTWFGWALRKLTAKSDADYAGRDRFSRRD